MRRCRAEACCSVLQQTTGSVSVVREGGRWAVGSVSRPGGWVARALPGGPLGLACRRARVGGFWGESWRCACIHAGCNRATAVTRSTWFWPVRDPQTAPSPGVSPLSGVSLLSGVSPLSGVHCPVSGHNGVTRKTSSWRYAVYRPLSGYALIGYNARMKYPGTPLLCKSS